MEGYDVERHKQFLAEGKSHAEIGRIFGLSVTTVWKRAKKFQPAEVPVKTANNADRHLCRTCKYRAEGAKKGCDYYVITDEPRGCDPDECTKYVKGDQFVRY